jgi:hypothetical protein
MKPAELFIGGSFADDFKDAQSVIQNGGTITGTPSIDNGITLDGTSDYVTYALAGIENASSTISYFIKFYPDFATSVDADKTLFYGDKSGSETFWIKKRQNSNNNTLWIRLSGTTIANIAEATYSPYWKQNSKNIIVLSSTSGGGTTKIWLNGNLILSVSTSYIAASGADLLSIGAAASGSDKFSGKITEFKIFKSLLTAQDAQNFYDNSTYKYMDDAVVNLSFKAAQHDPTNTRTLDISGNNNHATFGDGVTSTTFPTKLQRRGYSFDGGDYNVITNDTTLAFGTDDFTVAALVKSSIVNNATHWIIDKGFGEANNRLILGLDSTNKLKIHVGAIEAAGSVINEDSYYTVVGVRNGDNVYLYVNGIEDASNTGASAKVITSTTDLYIGARSATPASYWDGEMSVVYLLNGKGLTPLQVADLHINMLQEINHV